MMVGTGTVVVGGEEITEAHFTLQGIQYVRDVRTVDGQSERMNLRTDVRGSIQLLNPSALPRTLPNGRLKLRLPSGELVGLILGEGWNPFGRYSVAGDASEGD